MQEFSLAKTIEFVYLVRSWLGKRYYFLNCFQVYCISKRGM